MARLDQELVDRELCPSREKAKRAVLAGTVRVNGQVARKPSDRIKPGDQITLDAPEKYVSRGGHKLEHGLTHFQVNPAGARAFDLGASTGGFTDCLLRHGAIQVYAIDVGQGLLAWKLRTDPRVAVMEKTNARYLVPGDFPQPFSPLDLGVVDCSFISLRKILPAAVALLRPGGKLLALIKPQFEAGKTEAAKGAGVISDPAVHDRILDELKAFVQSSFPDVQWRGATPSPLLGPAGNKEFLLLLEKNL
jgi:23S rRNA (cytidine1920-2'-O)/16S rRNA (cytidine1409-2'-O)-methyltransferase